MPGVSSVTLYWQVIELSKPKFNDSSQHLSAHCVPNTVMCFYLCYLFLPVILLSGYLKWHHFHFTDEDTKT